MNRPPDDPLITLRREVRRELFDQEKTQKALAEKMGISRQSLARRLRGEVDITVNELKTLALALGKPASTYLALFDGTSTDSSAPQP